MIGWKGAAMGKDNATLFKRNRYYEGKLLTSGDFKLEQDYMNGKRQFINSRLLGSGITYGLTVCMMDGQSVRIDEGAAIDSKGREIIVPSAVIKKLSAINDFKEVESADALLCIRYKEEEVHPVYSSIQSTGNEYECSHIEEGYELYLKNAQPYSAYAADDAGWEEGLFLTGILVDNDDYLAYVRMPVSVPDKKAVKLELAILKKSDAECSLSLNMKAVLVSCADADGSQEIQVNIENIVPDKGEFTHREYWISPMPADAARVGVIIQKEDIRLKLGDAEQEFEEDIKLQADVKDMTPYELCVWEAGRLGESGGSNADEGIVLACIRMTWVDSVYSIDKIQEKGFKRYIAAPAQDALRNRYLSFFRDPIRRQLPLSTDTSAENELSTGFNDYGTILSCGVVEIPLDMDMKKGDLCYSDEIMHGLGKGNVYVQAGIEYMEDTVGLKHPYRHTIYGNSELFSQKEAMSVETAIDVNHDKGSFRIAARLLGEQNSIILKYNWVAVKFRTAKDIYAGQEDIQGSISLKTPTVILKARESHLFLVDFHDMEPCRLLFELTEPGSGEITADGMYTAPAREGVYEIAISCADMPQIHTFAYAVVEKRL